MSSFRRRDLRLYLLCVATIAIGIALSRPTIVRMGAAHDFLIVVDITGSMNVRDYNEAGQAISRLERSKAALRALVADLPCQSRVGLGIFTERQSFLLFEPVPLCDNFSAVIGAIDSLDWRMAWEGDSYVSRGLYSGIELARNLRADLLFLTDGHEAPPLPSSGPPAFPGKPGEVGGVVVGVGGLDPAPIPKFDERGNAIGFWAMAEVPQENRSGLPPKDAASRAGYNPRNAPFGGEAAVGTEHLSALREAHLRHLATVTALGYVRLDRGSDWQSVVLEHAHSRQLETETDLRPLPAAVAMLALVLVYALPLLKGS
jgi:mxaL protein